MTLKAVIFDVDGTLADTEEAHREAFNNVFREFGLPWHWDVELYVELLGVAGGKERLRHYCRCVDSARLAAPDAGAFIARLHERKTRAYNRRVAQGEVPARPGVSRLIGELRAAGVRLAIATTTSRANVDVLLDTTLADLPPGTFEVIGAGEEARAGHLSLGARRTRLVRPRLPRHRGFKKWRARRVRSRHSGVGDGKQLDTPRRFHRCRRRPARPRRGRPCRPAPFP